MKKKIEEQEKAISLRKEGFSLKDISDSLGVSKSSVSYWVRSVDLTGQQKERLDARYSFNGCVKGAESNRIKALKSRLSFQEEGRTIARKNSENKDFLIGCALYWAEGNKSRTCVGMSNMDVCILNRFQCWVKDFFGEYTFKSQVNAYLNNGLSIDDVLNYWSSALSIPKCNFGKVVAREKYYSGENRIKITPYGVCQLRLSNVYVAQMVYGSIQEAMKIDKPEWSA